MAAFQTSSLAFSDHNNSRTGHGLLKNLPTRVSKQHLVESKMFGSKRKNIQIGKKFKKVGKGISSKPSSGDPLMKAKGISPSIEEFDAMMAKISGKGSGKKSSGFSKKSMFSRKQFG